MTIQIDSREKARAIKKIIAEFDKNKVDYYVSKLYVGDYMSLDNPRLVVDRKQNLTEVCGNVTADHDRFRAELIRAKEKGIKLIILVEHGEGITCIDDVIFWVNPRRVKRELVNGQWVNKFTNAMTGATLASIMRTMERKYGVEFMFCDKSETGKKIMELLNG